MTKKPHKLDILRPLKEADSRLHNRDFLFQPRPQHIPKNMPTYTWSRDFALSSYVESRRKDILCSVLVSVVLCAAGWASPVAHVEGQVLNDVATSGACLAAGIEAVDLHELPAVPGALVREESQEHAPSRIRDYSGEAVVTDHPGDVQILDDDHLVLANESAKIELCHLRKPDSEDIRESTDKSDLRKDCAPTAHPRVSTARLGVSPAPKRNETLAWPVGHGSEFSASALSVAPISGASGCAVRAVLVGKPTVTKDYETPFLITMAGNAPVAARLWRFFFASTTLITMEHGIAAKSAEALSSTRGWQRTTIPVGSKHFVGIAITGSSAMVENALTNSESDETTAPDGPAQQHLLCRSWVESIFETSQNHAHTIACAHVKSSA